MELKQYIKSIQQDFPILATKVNGYDLAYLDNAATTQKPRHVIDAIDSYYANINSNVHRAVYYLSECATEAFEQARLKVSKFINAPDPKECIFVRGTTEAINLVAQSFGQAFITNGDEILLSVMEHHSNIVPWKLLCERTGAIIKLIPITQEGELDLTNLEQLLSPKTKIVAITHLSNSLGTLNPVKKIIASAHAKNIPVLIDGAQAAAHQRIDVQDLDCDFYCLSAHKCYGPMGIGVLYGKQKWLEQMPPYQGGGEMILQVSFDKITYNELPFKFEAGTPSVADAVGWGAAIDYLSNLDRKKLEEHENALLSYATNKLQAIPHIKFYGTAKHKGPILSFTLDPIHPHDLGTIVNEYGVAVRAGHHCNMPLMEFFGISGTTRASFAFYNDTDDVDQLCAALLQAQEVFNKKKK